MSQPWEQTSSISGSSACCISESEHLKEVLPRGQGNTKGTRGQSKDSELRGLVRYELNLVILLLLPLLVLGNTETSRQPLILSYSCQPEDRDWGRPLFPGSEKRTSVIPSIISPQLDSVCSFPKTAGPTLCQPFTTLVENEEGVFAFRIYFGLYEENNHIEEPTFDVSLDGTLIASLLPGWRKFDEGCFVEVYVHLYAPDATTLCVHNKNHGDPALLALQILEVNKMSYRIAHTSEWKMMKSVQRLSSGIQRPEYEDGSEWGGNRLWFPISGFPVVRTTMTVELAPSAEHYSQRIYHSAIFASLISLKIGVVANQKYGIWLHFAEINSSITTVGQRVFDVYVNQKLSFKNVDILEKVGSDTLLWF